MTIKKNSRLRLYQLDLIRFIAALYVVIYHYAFRGFNKDTLSPLQFEYFEPFAKYGYLGVDLFFMISGFVILMTAINSNIISFSISRVSRLYPAYWICLTITTIVIFFWGEENFLVNTYLYIANLTMLNGFFKIDYIDGVYWSLLVELKFYILIGGLLLLKRMRSLTGFIYIWLILSTLFIIVSSFSWNPLLSVINYFFIPKWCSYFIAGMLFFQIKTDGKIARRVIPLVWCFVLSCGYSFLKVEGMNLKYNDVFSHYIVLFIILFFYLFFFMFSTNRLNQLNKPIFHKLGMLTYPLYLLHQNIGYILFDRFNTRFNKYVLLMLVLSLVIYSSYLISTKLEKPLGKIIKGKMMQSSFLEKTKYLRNIKNS